MKCTHEFWEREASVATEGYCPIRMAERLGHDRVLKETDAFCPSCGHNRDKSSVSSIDHGSFKSCQKCGAMWVEA